MTRTVSFRSVWATTRTCPRVDAPIVRKRASASECTSSANVVDNGSSRTVAASWKLTRCLLRFAAAFAGSHSNCTARVYGPEPGDHQTAERSASAAPGHGRRLHAVVRQQADHRLVLTLRTDAMQTNCMTSGF